MPVLIGAVCFEGQSDQGVAYVLDLTERKRAEAERLCAEEALRRSQLQLQQMVDTVPVQIWCVTPGGEPAYINRTMVDYIGLKLDDFDAEGGLPGAIEAIVHPDVRRNVERFEGLTHRERQVSPRSRAQAIQQADRLRPQHQRGHGQTASWQCHAQDGGNLGRRVDPHMGNATCLGTRSPGYGVMARYSEPRNSVAVEAALYAKPQVTAAVPHELSQEAPPSVKRIVRMRGLRPGSF